MYQISNEFMVVWFVATMVMFFIVVLMEYFFPTGEGYSVAHLVVHFHGDEEPSIEIRSEGLFAFRITAILYNIFKASKGSFIEYHAR